MAANQNGWGAWKGALVCTGGGLKVAFSVGLLIALHMALFPIMFFLGVSGSAIALAAYIAAGRRFSGLVRTFKEIEEIGPKAVFNNAHLMRDHILHWLADCPFWRNAVCVIWKLAEAVATSVLRRRPRPSLDGIRTLVERIDAEKLVASPSEFQVAVNYRATPEDPFDRHRLISNHNARFDPARGGNPKDFLEDILGSASFPPFIYNPERFDGLYVREGFKAAIDSGANIIFVAVNDQPGGDMRGGIFPETMKAYNTMYDPGFVDCIKVLLYEHPRFTVWTGDSPIPYLAEIAAFARSIGRYGMSEFCFIFVAPKILVGKLSTTEFGKGDITAAIEHTMEYGKEMLAELRATYDRYHPTNDAPAA